jgi:serine/threonine protein kinase
LDGEKLDEDNQAILNQRTSELELLRAKQQEQIESKHLLPMPEIEAKLKRFEFWLHESSNYQMVRLVGRGGSSEVYCGFDKCDGQSVAIKLFKSPSFTPRQFAQFERELQVLSQLKLASMSQDVLDDWIDSRL